MADDGFGDVSQAAAIALLDVGYLDRGARAACVLAHSWTASVASSEHVVDIAAVQPYEPGHFYRRELPCLLAILERIAVPPSLLVIDGYVWLDGAARPGLGAHLFEALGSNVPVVGIAKSAFAGAQRCAAVAEVLRGRSGRPLFVSAAGVALETAAQAVLGMAGPHRIPALVAAVDRLSRSTGAVDVESPTDPSTHAAFATRRVTIGGKSRQHLLQELLAHGVALNAAAHELFASDRLTTCARQRTLLTAELAVRQLGLADGATIAQIHRSAAARGLSLAPIELGPHLRLQYTDQPEGFLNQPATSHRAPPGSLTIASAPLSDDDRFPKGFYLRRIEGTLWLRGYRSDAAHHWDADDRFVFCRSPAS